MTISQIMLSRIQIIVLLICGFTHITNAVLYQPESLLNGFAHADLNVLDSMMPHRSYFIEFPSSLQYFIPDSIVPPMCGDRSDFSFLFRKGSKDHYRKLIVEFEGGPACWGTQCTCANGLKVPWHDYAHAYNDTDDQALPRLGSCNGIVDGFVSELSTSLFENTTAFDIPLMQRDSSASSDQPWWDKLAKDGSSFKDWSYILIPHCTMDWHLGYAQNVHLVDCEQATERVFHRGGANRDAVLAWVVRQFGDEQLSLQEYYLNRNSLAGTGLDGLVTVAGGKMGGCDASNPQHASSSVAAAAFAYNAASYFQTLGSALVLVEGASLFQSGLPTSNQLRQTFEAIDLPFQNLPYDLQYMVERAPPAVHFAWVSSPAGAGSGLEGRLLGDMKDTKGDNFHLFTPSATTTSNAFQSSYCPKYAFPDDDQEFGDFLGQVVGQLYWTSYDSFADDSASSESLTFDELLGINSNGDSGEDGQVTLRLSWLAVAVIILGIVAFLYLCYFLLRFYRWKQNKPPPMGPYQMWLHALTHYPLCFLLVSLAIPCFLSWLVVARAGYTLNVNLDFDTYLAVSSESTIVAENYNDAVLFQETSSRAADDMCSALGDWAVFRDESRRSLFEMEDQTNATMQSFNASRHLQEALYRTTVQIYYQNPEGGNVFTPTMLEEMRRFEQDVRFFPDYERFCRRLSDGSCRFGSSLQWLYEDGYLVPNIEAALAEKATPEKVDQYFNVPYNLASNMTKSFVYFEGSKSAVNEFLKGFYQDFLKKSDQENLYPKIIFTWQNGLLQQQEANEALLHDALWSVGSLVVIGVMIYLKVQDFFIFFFGMTGLILAFSTSYYWCTTHFGIPEITLLHVSGLFVMLGIGADDIFLMVDSYEHAKVALGDAEEGQIVQPEESEDFESSADPDADRDNRKRHRVEKIRKQMLWAYSTAGGMMLVSSMTAAVCFFSNAFGVLLVIQDFGIFMGMVVLINFFHVMTILPSAILVKELYLKPCCCGAPEQKDDGAGSSRNRSKESRNRVSDVEAHYNNRRSPENASSGRRTDNLAEQDLPSSELGMMDRLLYKRYAPFLDRQRIPILVLSVLFAVVIGSIGLANLEFTDGTIVIFTDDYNQGRLISIKNAYYSQLDPSKLNLGSTGSGGGLGTGGNSGGGNLGGGSGIDGGTGGNTGGFPGEIPDDIPIDIPTGGGGGSTGGGGSSVGGDGGTTGGNGNGSGGNSGGSGTGSNGGGTGSNGGSGGSNSGGGGSGVGGIGGGTPVPSPTRVPTAPLPNPTPITNTGNQTTTSEETSVKLLWGIDTQTADSTGPWRVKSSTKKIQEDTTSLLAGVSGFDVTEPANQQWLLDVALAARGDFSLNAISSEPTWIEILADFANKQDHGFPVPKELFMPYVEILQFKDPTFEEIVKDEIGTSLPGLAGRPLYASITFQSGVSSSLGSFNKWTSFADSMNEKSPQDVPPMVAKSDLFWNSARAQETIDATVNTWLLANLLCFAIILLFTQNLVLFGMVVGTIILMFMCIAGWLFAVLDRAVGPVQALGVSIFIGLSANYSLHVVHAYHRARSTNRVNKVKQAVFITGSPICASAISTIGGCVFLLGCRAIPLVELGMLICCVTAMALIYSMGFLLAWLLVMGPLPTGDVDDGVGRKLHNGDITWLCHKASKHLASARSNESMVSSARQIRSGASSALSYLKTKLEGKFSKKSSLEEELQNTERDNTKSTPTFPSSASNLSEENHPMEGNSTKNASSEVKAGQMLAPRSGYTADNTTTAPNYDRSLGGEAVRQHQPNPPSARAPISSAQMHAQPEQLPRGYGASSLPYNASATDSMQMQAHPEQLPRGYAGSSMPYTPSAPGSMQMQAQPEQLPRGYAGSSMPCTPSAPVSSMQMQTQPEQQPRGYAGSSMPYTPSAPISSMQIQTQPEQQPRGYPGASMPYTPSAPISSMQMQTQPEQQPRGYPGASMQYTPSAPINSMQMQTQPEQQPRGYAVPSMMYPPTEHRQNGYGHGGLATRGPEVAESTSLPAPRSNRDELMGEVGDIPSITTQTSNKQVPQEHAPTETVPDKEDDSSDMWDLQSIISYLSGTDRVDTTPAVQPASMLMLGPQDDDSVTSGLALDPMDHAQSILPTKLEEDEASMPFDILPPKIDDDDGSMPFDEM